MNNKPDVGYRFVECSHYDPERTHWTLGDGWHERVCQNDKCEECRSRKWRKPVPIPDGWELVPEGELVLSGYRYWSLCPGYDWQYVFGGSGHAGKGGRNSQAYIRRKSDAHTPVQWDKPLFTRDGRKARLLGTINARNRSHVVAIMRTDGQEIESRHYPDGGVTQDREHKRDIVNQPEKPKRVEREAWVNVYRNESHAVGYPTRAEADAKAGDRIACVRVEIDCEEGEGLK